MNLSESRIFKFDNHLRVKLMLLILAMLLITELVIFVPLGLFMVNHERENLMKGLYDRVHILLRNLSIQAENILLIQDRMEMTLI